MHGIDPHDEIAYWRGQARHARDWRAWADGICLAHRIACGPVVGDEAVRSMIGQRVDGATEQFTYWRDQARHWQAKAEAAERELLERNAQLDAVRIPIGGACVDHSELNGHIDIANECVDWIDTEAMDSGDPSGKLRGYVASLSIVILQLDRQRRRANWYESVYQAGKTKLIESAVSDAAHQLANERRVAADLRDTNQQLCEQVAELNAGCVAYENVVRVVRDLTCDGCEYEDNCPSNARHYVCRTCHLTRALAALDALDGGGKP